jgi:hypothetical protein
MYPAQRMMTIQVELDSRRLGGGALLIPFSDDTLASIPCRQMLKQVLDEQLNQPNFLANAEKASFLIIKQHDNVSSSGRKTHVDKDLADATTCMDMSALSVIASFSTEFFNFKVTSQSSAVSQARNLQNAFEVLRPVHTSYVFCLRVSSMRVCTPTITATTRC